MLLLDFQSSSLWGGLAGPSRRAVGSYPWWCPLWVPELMMACWVCRSVHAGSTPPPGHKSLMLDRTPSSPWNGYCSCLCTSVRDTAWERYRKHFFISSFRDDFVSWFWNKYFPDFLVNAVRVTYNCALSSYFLDNQKINGNSQVVLVLSFRDVILICFHTNIKLSKSTNKANAFPWFSYFSKTGA